MSADPEQAIHKLLTSASGVTDLVSTRIFPNMATEGVAKPYVVYQTVSDVPEHHAGGASGLAAARIQIAAIDETYAGAKAVREQIRQALDGYSGTVTVTADPLLTVVVDSIIKEGGEDNPIPPGDATGVGLFGVLQDFIVWYEEEVPSF